MNMILLKFRKYHKMSYSYYPFMVGMGIFGFVFSLAFFMVMGQWFSMMVCFFYMSYIAVLWIKDVSLEDISGEYSFYDYQMFVQGFRLFLFSELSLFFSIFWCFFDSSMCSLAWLGGDWCPFGILSPEYLGLNSVMSMFLMMNSHILKYSRRYLCLNVLYCEIFLLVCIFIGGSFLCFQYYEYSSNCFVMSDSVYGSVFYIGTGLHGSHVFIGVCFLVVNFLRIKFFNFSWYHVQAFDMSIDYWRFLEWMWGIMFCLLYIWGS